MKGEIKVKFNELSKSVTAETSIVATDVELTAENTEKLLKDNELLFNKAREFAHLQTLKKQNLS